MSKLIDNTQKKEMIGLSKYAEHILNNVQLAGAQQSAYCFQEIECCCCL
jgi:hypothetical protein